MTDYLPARDINPGRQVFVNAKWHTVEVAVLIRRADGSERVTFATAEATVPIEVEADDEYTVRWESNEAS